VIKRILSCTASSIDRISIALSSLGALFILATACFITYEVITRHFFNRPTIWTFDTAIYMILAAMFFAAAHVAKDDGHVCVDFITIRLSIKTRSFLEIITYSWSVLFCIVFVYSAVRMVYISATQSILDNTDIALPLAIPQAALTLGIMVLALQLIKITVTKYHSVLIRRENGNDSAESSFVSCVDRPLVLIPIVIGLLTIATVFFYLGGGGLRTAGLILLLLTILATGTPVFIAVGMVGSVGLLVLFGGGLASQHQVALLSYKSLNSFVVGAIPLFIMAAGILSVGGLGEKLYDVCRKWLPPLRGKLAIATVVACAIFAAISGSSIANAAAFSLIAIPPMLALGYDKRLAYGSVAGGGTLGILIPPSGAFIMYGYLTGESVGRLFIAGIVPGIMISLFFIVYVVIRCRKDMRYQADAATKIPWKERFSALKGALLILFAPILILGTIYLGIATPTEAAAVTVVYALIVNTITGKLDRRNLFRALRDSSKNASMVLMILAGATIFGGVLTILQIPQGFVYFAVNAPIPVWGIIVLINLLLFVLGMFMECIAITVITIPIIFPAIVALKLDPIWFGVLFVINMEIALVSPPVGMNLYVIKGTTGEKLEEVMRGAFPFLLILLLGLLIVGLYQPLSTWLPSTMMK
jgi:C4-dicarboxylate transporter DctM subunit